MLAIWNRNAWNGWVNPWALLAQAERELWKANESGHWSHAHSNRAPAVEVQNEKDSYRLTAEVPGVRKEDLKIQLEGNLLTLSVERKEEYPEGYQVHRKERASYKLQQSYRLPDSIDADKVEAKLENGVLTVRIPKVPEVQPKQIPIQVG